MEREGLDNHLREETKDSDDVQIVSSKSPIFLEVLKEWKMQRRSDCEIDQAQSLYKCLICSKIFTQKQFKRHKEGVHKNHQQQKIRLKQQNMDYSCRACKHEDEKFKDILEFKLHLLTHTFEELELAGYNIKEIWRNNPTALQIIGDRSRLYELESLDRENDQEDYRYACLKERVDSQRSELQQELDEISNQCLDAPSRKKAVFKATYPYSEIIQMEEFNYVIREADAHDILIILHQKLTEEMRDSKLHYERFSIDSLTKNSRLCLQMKNQFKYLNLARELNLKWVLHLKNVIRTPDEIFLVTAAYEMTFDQYLRQYNDKAKSIKLLWQIVNAVQTIHNYRIVHRALMPESILVNTYPQLSIKVTNFYHCSNSFEEGVPFNIPEVGYVPMKKKWTGGSKWWDMYALGVLIFYWYQKSKLMSEKFANEEELRRIAKSDLAKVDTPEIVKDVIRQIILTQETMPKLSYIRDQIALMPKE